MNPTRREPMTVEECVDVVDRDLWFWAALTRFGRGTWRWIKEFSKHIVPIGALVVALLTYLGHK